MEFAFKTNASNIFKQLFSKGKSSLLEFVFEDEGTGQFAEAEFEELSEAQEEFGLEEEECETVETIRTMQFNSAMIMPTDPPKLNETSPLQLTKSIYKRGLNVQGTVFFIYLNESPCFAVGNSVVWNNTLYTAHKSTVTYLAYAEEYKVLMSAGESISPEILLWDVMVDKLQWKHTLHQAHRSGSVMYAALLDAETMLSISSYGLHRNSVIYLYDVSKKSREVVDVNVGKVLSVINKRGYSLKVVNRMGICLVDVKEKKIELILEEGGVTCAMEVEEGVYVVGDKEGRITLVREGKKIGVKDVHEGIACGVIGEQGNVVSWGLKDKNVYILGIKEGREIIVEKKISLMTNCKQVVGNENEIIAVDGVGNITKINKKTYEYEKNKTISQINDLEFGVFNRHSRKMYYVRGRNLYGYGIDDNSEIEVILRSKPIAFDAFSTLVAYVTYSEVYELIVEDISFKKLIVRLEIKSSAIVTVLKFNVEGSKISIGFEDGSIEIYSFDNDCLLLCKSDKNNSHQNKIVEIVWAINGEFLKTMTLKELFYFKINEENKEFKLEKIKPKSVQNLKWVEIGRFGWETKEMWKEMNFVDDVTCVRGIENYTFVCLSTGELRVYNRPTVSKKYSSYKFFSNPFSAVVSNSNKRNTVMLYSEGRVLLLEMEE